MSTFANRVRELRGSESQASFANTIGIHAIQYSKYERGVNAPSIEVLERICRAHACSADWLLGLTDGRDSTTMMKPPTPAVNLEELRSTATQLADEASALSLTIKKLKKMV